MRPDEILALVGPVAESTRVVPAGEVILAEGQTISDVLFVAQGEVELRLPGIPPVVLDRRGSGSVIGAEWALTGKPTTCQALALTDARLLALSRPALLQLLQDSEPFSEYFLLQTLEGKQAMQVAAGRMHARSNLLEAHIARQVDLKYGELIGESRAMQALRAEIERYAASGDPVLLVGEPGVGKELMAAHIHLGGPRQSETYLSLRAGDWQADRWREQTEMAAGGTIIIKNIAGLPREATTSVGALAVRASSDRPRLIATLTMRPGEAAPPVPPPWKTVPRLRIPPLRDRKTDIPDLARSFLREQNAVYGATDEPISTEAMRMLVAYPYLAGNVAELYGVITHAAHLAAGGSIQAQHIRLGVHGQHLGRPIVGVALGGGVVRGMAHIGVLQVLQEERIPIDIVAGTSVGSLVGAVFAGGFPLSDLENLAPTLSWPKLVGPTWPRDGLLSSAKLGKFVESLVGARQVQELKVPYAAVAVDRDTGDEVILREGPVGTAVRASTAIPGLFMPIESEGRRLIDGGLVNNVPASVVRAMGADIVIAVDVRDYNYFDPGRGGLMLSFLRAYDIMIHKAAQSELEWADVAIMATRPGINPYGFKMAKELIEAGREQARLAIPAIRAAMTSAEAQVS